MLNLGHGVQVFLMTGATDMRKAVNGLAQIVINSELDLLGGAFFVFANKSAKIIKVLYWDRNGFCLWQKRLEKERFPWPKSKKDVLQMEAHSLRILLEGINPFQSKIHKSLSFNQLE